MAGYTKEFLIDAFLWRYTDTLLSKDSTVNLDKYVQMVKTYADSVSIETFRKYASLDADEIKKFRLATGY
jgi:hypothetical protein